MITSLDRFPSVESEDSGYLAVGVDHTTDRVGLGRCVDPHEMANRAWTSRIEWWADSENCWSASEPADDAKSLADGKAGWNNDRTQTAPRRSTSRTSGHQSWSSSWVDPSIPSRPACRCIVQLSRPSCSSDPRIRRAVAAKPSRTVGQRNKRCHGQTGRTRSCIRHNQGWHFAVFVNVSAVPEGTRSVTRYDGSVNRAPGRV